MFSPSPLRLMPFLLERLGWAEWGAKFVQKSAAQNVQVQVVDDLACIDALIQGNPVAAFGYSGLACDT